MTTLGSLVVPAGRANGKTAAQPLDLTDVIKQVALLASAHAPTLGPLPQIVASVQAWTSQDDDAHEPCSLTACRAPLHPGPCKGWKGILHSVSPGTYRQIEEERVRKANERRVKRIADLRSQGKPIPRRLLVEIKPKPAPGHHANGVQAVPPAQVNQKADLAGGQAHHAGQAISNAAGVKPSKPLPLGPKQKKPTVAGRGPAFVITQPKVTDTYKLDKAAKITPQEWSGLPDADKTAIRNELTAIKARGFGPQQKKADDLLDKLPAPGVGQKLKPGTPGTITTPGGHTYQKVSATPGKVTLGQAVKSTPAGPAHVGSFTQASTAIRITEAIHGVQNTDTQKLASFLEKAKQTGPLDQNPKFRLLVDRLANDALKQASADKMPGLGHGANDVGITEFNHEIRDHILEGKPGLPPLIQRMEDHHKVTVVKNGAPGAPNVPQAAPASSPATPSAPGGRKTYSVTYNGKTVTRTSTQPYTHASIVRWSNGSEDVASFHTSEKAALQGVLTAQQKKNGAQVIKAVEVKAADTSAPSHSTPQAAPAATAPNGMPKVLPAHAQAARAVAARTFGGAPTAKKHLVAYGKLSKADFDLLDEKTQRTIRDDLANAKAKFLDPKKKQEASDLLDRFGSRHTSPAPSGNVPNPPAGHPKGYSDPQAEAVKAASSGLIVNADVLKTVARLTPDQVKGLDDTDRKQILGRLAFIATHPKAPQEEKDKAAAYGRIINGGTHVPSTVKFDHEPSIGELHAEERKGGHVTIFGAIVAANDKTMSRDARIAALTALTKPQFDSLTPDEQRQVTDALHELHVEKQTPSGSASVRSPEVEAAFQKYTGLNPGVHRLKQAEADFRAGKLDTGPYKGFHKELLSARVQDPGSHHTPGSPGDLLEKEAQRIAEDNPKLPLWLRAEMVPDVSIGTGGPYHSIRAATNPFNWEDAPRLSSTDISNIFRADVDELASAHPIQAEAVKALREHLIATGLKGSPGVPSGSPWSLATRNQVVDSLLNVSPSEPEVSAVRLKEFDSLPMGGQVLVRRALTDRLNSQSNDHAKVGTFITLHALERRQQFTPEQVEALKVASDTYATNHDVEAYRKLTPAEYDQLPPYARRAIADHLNTLSTRASRSGPVATWAPQDNPFKVMPRALAAHLDGTRSSYSDRRQRNAADLANYGTGIVNPFDRTRAYGEVNVGPFKAMDPADQQAILSDLDKIASDPAHNLFVRYNAQFTKDVNLGQVGSLGDLANGAGIERLVAVASVNPTQTLTDSQVETAFNNLPKADFDKLDKVYQEAIDERIKKLPGTSQQALTAKFHPSTPQTANPTGLTPTSVQANVPPHVQAALDTIYGTHASGKSHTMAHQLATYGALRGHDFQHLNPQEQGHLLGDLSFIATTAKGPSADKAKKLIDRFTPAGTPSGQVPTGAVIPPANAVPGQQRYATPLKGLEKAKDSGTSGDGWFNQGGQRVWGKHGAAGLMLMHQDPQTGEKRYLMVQRGPAISDPGKWTFPGGASDSKETPHQGAARETIEELGLKDDALKDALVHGDFTYSIPNSNWKYTSVAAQVPTMIKPNLSTAHARAETSDAKWMTEAEIKALDAAGKLHHPIAGGKLEQNVLSLFPQGNVTLGQIARPGPVTKRQGRLSLPYGGRQSPASFNAWPHAHKPSKGKSLVADKAAIDKLRQDVKQARTAYDGKTADGRLAAIGNMQGFDDTPTVMSKAEVDKLLATGDYIEVWRGVKGGYRSGGKSAADINEEMRSGPAYYGKGIFGNGYYLATQKSVARQYSDGSKNSIARILIPKSAVMQQYKDVEQEAHAASSPTSKAKGGRYEDGTLYDPGRWAAAKGIDGIEIQHHHTSGGGWARHIAASGKPAYNWLNRSVLIIQEAE